MKGLNQFLKFDFDAFAQGKQFTVVGTGEYADFETKQHLGTKVDCVITIDKTPYDFKDGKSFTNRYEKITFKVEKDVSIPIDAHVMPKGVTARVYGEYRNQLAVTCKDIAVANTQATTSTSAGLKKEN